MKRVILCAAVVLSCGSLLVGCALTSKAETLSYRYFTVDPGESTAKPERLDEIRRDVKLRLGRVTSSGHLKNRIVYRTSPVELGVYDDLRWTERPEEYLRRSLSLALFETRGLTQVVAGAAPTLDVELLAFEELRDGDARIARVSMHYALHDERAVLAQDTITVEVDAAGARGTEELVAALSSALGVTTARLADDVSERLAPTPGQPLHQHSKRD